MYVTETSYLSHYYKDLSPIHLSFIAAINNCNPPDINNDFTYCELGCGCGKTTNTIAATHQNAQCVGIDFNEKHIQIAKKESYNLKNIQFINKTFSQSLDEDLPQFDFIVMHGVWSWVTKSVRADIMKFVEKFLKPKGLFYISYNAMPGWAQMQPFAKMMSLYAENIEGSLEEKAKSALLYLSYLRTNKSDFFETSPNAQMYLNLLENSDTRYVIHELFNEILAPEYFCDVNAEMQKIQLEFIGDCVAINNYTFNLPKAFQELLETTNDRIKIETNKSIIRNDKFRKDLYCKNPNKNSLNNTLKYLENFLFYNKYKQFSLETKFNGYSIELSDEPYSQIFQILSEEHITINSLNKKLGRLAKNLPDTLENILNCMLTEQCQISLNKNLDNKSLTEYNKQQILNWETSYSNIYIAQNGNSNAIVLSRLQAFVASSIILFDENKEAAIEHCYNFICNDMQNGDNVFAFAINDNINETLSATYDDMLFFQ